jgi:hypothetical protein
MNIQVYVNWYEQKFLEVNKLNKLNKSLMKFSISKFIYFYCSSKNILSLSNDWMRTFEYKLCV